MIDDETSAAALDFAPSDESAEAQEKDPVASLNESTSRLGVMTWVLVAVNVLILVAVIYMFSIVAQRSQDKQNDGDPTGQRGGAPSGDRAARAASVEPFVLTDPPPPPPAALPEPTPTPTTTDTRPPNVTDPFNDPAARAKIDAARRAEEARRIHNRVADMVNRAEELRVTGDLEGALAILESIHQNIDPEHHPRLLVRWINQTRESIDGKAQKSTTFFGVSDE